MKLLSVLFAIAMLALAVSASDTKKLSKRHSPAPPSLGANSLVKFLLGYWLMDLVWHSAMHVGIEKVIQNYEKDEGPYDDINKAKLEDRKGPQANPLSPASGLSAAMFDLFKALEGKTSEIVEVALSQHKSAKWMGDTNLMAVSENALAHMTEKESLYSRLNLTESVAYSEFMRRTVYVKMPQHLALLDKVLCGSFVTGDRQPSFVNFYDTLKDDYSLSVEDSIVKYREYVQAVIMLQTAGHILYLKSVPYVHGFNTSATRVLLDKLQDEYMARMEFQLAASVTALSSPLLSYLYVPSGIHQLAEEDLSTADSVPSSGTFAVVTPNDRFALGFTDKSNLMIAANPVNSEDQAYRKAFGWKLVISENNTLLMTNGYVDVPMSLYRSSARKDQFCIKTDSGFLGLAFPGSNTMTHSVLGYYVNNKGNVNAYRRMSSKGMRILGPFTMRKKRVGHLEFFGNDTVQNEYAKNQPLVFADMKDSECLTSWRIDPLHSNGYIMKTAGDSFTNFNGTDNDDSITGPAVIFAGAKIVSNNKLYSAQLTKTCALVVGFNPTANNNVTVVHKYVEMPSPRYIWASTNAGHVGKDGNHNSCAMHFLPNGFLQLWTFHEDSYSTAVNVTFASHTVVPRNHLGPFTLIMEDSGSLTIRDATNQLTWSTPSANKPDN